LSQTSIQSLKRSAQELNQQIAHQVAQVNLRKLNTDTYTVAQLVLATL
jgi:phenylpyruvate tautomerase PptA (4-oxalocrotonate tautomerase family)